jgi:septal ring factor EnvC (AmiA/AmiB activator)
MHHVDPGAAFGLASSVAQITELAINILINLYKFYRSIREAATRSKKLREELDTLVDLLNDAREIIERTSPLNVRQSLQKEIETMRQLLHDLNERTSLKETRGIKLLKWPFRQEENEQFIGRIERFKTSLNAILNIRQTYRT